MDRDGRDRDGHPGDQVRRHGDPARRGAGPGCWPARWPRSTCCPAAGSSSGSGSATTAGRSSARSARSTAPRERGLLLDESLEVLRRLLTGRGRRVRRRAAGRARPRRSCRGRCRIRCRSGSRAGGRTAGRWPGPPGAGLLPDLRRLAGLAARRRPEPRCAPTCPARRPDDYDLVVRCKLRRSARPERAKAVATARDSGVTWLLEGFGPGLSVAEFESVAAAGPPRELSRARSVAARRDRGAAVDCRPLGELLVPDHVHDRVDQRQVRERLREVAQVPP